MSRTYFESQTHSLTRDIVKSCWWIIAIYIAGTAANGLANPYEDQWGFIRDVTIIPGLKMIILWIALEVYVRRSRRHLKYVILFFTNLLVCTMILSLYTLPISVYFLIFPILFSLFYFRKEIIAFAILQGLLTMLLLYFCSENFRGMLATSDIFTVVAMLVGSALIMNKLRNHAFALAENLAAAIQDKQILQMENIRMDRLSRVDPVTELYNHKSFHEYLENLLSLQTPVDIYLALLDIDNFKQVNDTYGHAAGDVIIKYVSEEIRREWGPDDFASRYGGEEFGMIFVEKGGEQVIGQLERIRQAISETEHAVLSGNRVTISIGVQVLRPGMTKDDLFQAADAALYKAKRTGKNRTVEGT